MPGGVQKLSGLQGILGMYENLKFTAVCEFFSLIFILCSEQREGDEEKGRNQAVHAAPGGARAN